MAVSYEVLLANGTVVQSPDLWAWPESGHLTLMERPTNTIESRGKLIAVLAPGTWLAYREVRG